MQNKTVNIRFVNQANGIYTVQIVNPASQVVYNSSIEIRDANTTSSIQLGKAMAAGSYELSITAPDGRKTVQQVIVK